VISRKKVYYHGVRMAPYDLIKEFLLALGVVTVLVVLLSAILSSPDDPPLTIKGNIEDSAANLRQYRPQ
jgi:hypothetical protein